MKIVGMHEAKTHFSSLIKAVEDGEDVIVKRGDRPVARIVAHAAPRRRSRGALAGQIWMAEDFDATPPGFEHYTP